MSNNRPTPGEVETRRFEVAAEGRKIRGIVPYGIESRDMGGWKEVIDAGALRSTNLDELVARVDHAGVPIGRYPSTLELEDRTDGLTWAVTPPESRSDLLEAIERGDLRAGSWQMVVGKDRWDGDTRHIESIAELRDVSVVTSPAYPAAAVEYRTAPVRIDNDATEKESASNMADSEKTEARQEAPSEDKTEERSQTASNSADVRVTHEPAPQLNVEQRTDTTQATSLASLFEQRGFFENRTASVGWDEFRSFTWSAGTVLTDVNPLRRDGVPLGLDRRWLYPALPSTAVDAATTSVQYLRPSSRSLAAGTAVIRPLDSVTTKPETSSTAEIQTLQLNQVASVQTGIPRIHAAQPLFQSIVEQDLRDAISGGLDQLVITRVSTAGTSAAVTGNMLDKVRKAITVVQGNGYSPSVLAIDPSGAESLDLLKSSGTEAFYVFNAGAAAPAPYGLEVRIWKNTGTAVIDAANFGRMYVAPLELRSFEADAGTTNKQNVRLETNAGFAVERTSAALRIN
jgi:uncharacterized protein